jgi:RNA polymerase sigma-70 factor (ECF subfamily)
VTCAFTAFCACESLHEPYFAVSFACVPRLENMRGKSDHRISLAAGAGSSHRSTSKADNGRVEIPRHFVSPTLELISLTAAATLLRIPHKRPQHLLGASHHLMSMTFPPTKEPSLAPERVREWFRDKGQADGTPPVYIREWLGDVVRSHYRVFYSIAYGYVRNHASAEDLVQNAIIKALRAVNKLHDPEAIVGWLAAITRNACLEEVRRKKGKYDEPVETAARLQQKKLNINLFETQKLVLGAINSLPENQAIVVRLRFLEDCDLDEIAQQLGLRKNTVEVRIHRALATLAKNPTLRAFRGTCQ